MSRFAATGRAEDRRVRLADVARNGGSRLLLQHLAVIHLRRLVVVPRRVAVFPGLPLPIVRPPLLVSDTFLPAEGVRQ